MLTLSPARAARALEADLRARFDRSLLDPETYRRRALDECRPFPEGDLLPFVFPAIGYANDALAHPERVAEARGKVATLIQLALPSVCARVSPPGGRLEAIADYGREGVYLGQLALALGCYRSIGGDDRWDAIHTRLADALHEALVAAEGRALWSFPTITWPFDTVPCLLALRLYDLHRGDARSDAAIARHLDWVALHATDHELDLPHSSIDQDSGRGLALPRGCDLSYRTWLLSRIDRPRAERLYSAYCRRYWRDYGWIAGFTEWPGGRELGEDCDSGPVFLGLGLAATGFGLGAALAMGDSWRLGRLLFQLLGTRNLLFPPLKPILGRMCPFDDRCVTGSLMGDAAVFGVIGGG